MSQMEKEAIFNFVNGCCKEEKIFMAECLPIEILYNRIGQVLSEKKDLEEKLRNVAENFL